MNGQCYHSVCSTFFVALLVMGMGFPAQGATITWTNTSGGNWSATNNWSPNQVPSAADTALITTSGTYVITNNANSQVASLTLGAASGTQTLTVNGSTLSITNGGTVGANGVLNLSGSTLTGLLTVSGALNWSSGGILSGGSALTIASNAVLNISGSFSESLYGVLTNAGTVNWSGTGNLNVYNFSPSGYTGGIVNLTGAVFNAQNDQTISSSQGTPAFNNAGTFLKSPGTNTTTISVQFNNTGALNVATGTVAFNNNTTDNGTIIGAGKVSVTGGTLTLNGAAPNLILVNGTVTGVNASITNLTWSGGTLQNTNATVTGLASWTGGSLGGGSSLTIASNAVLNISGSSTVSLFGALTNAGTVNWTGTVDVNVYNNAANGYSGEIVNLAGALFNAQNDRTISTSQGTPVFNNAGTFLKSPGTNTTTLNLVFNNTGILNVASGTMALNGNDTDNGTITGAGNVSVTGGTLMLNGAAPNLILVGGTVAGVNASIGNLTWSSGTLQNTNATVTGLASWTGGSLGPGSALRIETSAVLSISGNSTVSLYGALTNAGTVNWTGTVDVSVYNNSAIGYSGGIVNLAGALFNAQNDRTINTSQGSPTFNNAGTFLKSPGTNTTTLNLVFNNTGILNVASGTVALNGNDTDNGTITGAGNVSVTGGTLMLNGAAPNLILVGGTVAGVNASIGNLTLSGGTLQNTNATVTGLANWTGSSLGGGSSLTIASNAVLNISGNSTVSLYGALTNAGTVNWTGTVDVSVYNNSAIGYSGGIVNLAGALFNAQNDRTINTSQGSPTFNNAGTFLKSPGTNTTTLNLVFNNTGILNVASGTVALNGNDTDNGTITGAGNVSVTGGTLMLNGAAPNLILVGGTVAGVNASIGNLTLSGGTLQNTNATVTGLANWTGSSLGGGSSLTIASNAVLSISGSGTVNLYGVLTNAGTVNWSGTVDVTVNNYSPQGSSGGIVNLAGALFNVQNDRSMASGIGSPYFNNAGTFLKSAGTNTTITVIFNNTGAVNLNIYSRTSSGRINFSGNVVLAGIININFTNGYSPATGDAFTLVTYGSETGVFSSVNLPASLFWQTNTITYGSTAFTLTIGSFYQLAFTAGPTGTNSAGAVFAPVVVQAQYLNGAPLATNGVPVTMTMTSGSGTLSGTLTQNTDSTGKATFNDLSINLVGPKTLLASSPPWITPTSSVVIITSGPPVQLHITTPITSLQKQGYAFSPAPTVQVLDQFGNIVSNSTALITANSSSLGGGSLGGTTFVNPNGTNGSAKFGNLHYNLGNPNAAESVTVYYTSPGLVPATNSPIQVDFVFGMITLTNGNSLVQINPNTQDGMLSWVVDGTDQLFQHWFWLRQGANGPQLSFDQLGAPLGLLLTATNATINYLPQGLNVMLSFTLRGGATGSRSSSVVETISIQNTNNSAVGLHLFSYADFDLAGVSGGDTVSFPATNMVVQQGKSTTATQSVQGPAPNFWEASWYALTFDKINGAIPAILSDTNTPNAPGDQTFAYQWDTNLSAGQTYILTITNTVQGPPSTLVSLMISLAGTNAIISWPTTAANGLTLQSSSSLNPGSVWTNVAALPATVGTNYQVTIPQAGSAQFYRLH